MYKRSLVLPIHETFFLWGPRQTGKTSLLRATFPDGHLVDLLESDQFIKYQSRPSTLREEIQALVRNGVPPKIVIIDEIQKVPALLDEVHGMIERFRIPFALCGSSARKVKRGHGNLLGGRALRFEFLGLTAFELGADFDLPRLLNHGYLPRHYESQDPGARLRSYCSDYLKEEIAAEGLVRNLPSFSEFLSIATLSDCEQINFATIARDTGVSAPTAKSYFGILTDTLMGNYVLPYRKRPKRRISLAPKFYFSELGVVNHLAKRGRLEPGSELFGKAFENWVYHELNAFRAYRSPDLEIHYWKLSTGTEVDFILGQMECAIEAKASSRITSDHLKGLRELSTDHPTIKRKIIVCLEKEARETDDRILILPYAEFIRLLWSGGILS